MIWKTIGKSVIGTSHIAVDKPCEDTIAYKVVVTAGGEEVLICCVSDGAGSARFAVEASLYCTQSVTDVLVELAHSGVDIDKAKIYEVLERLYDGLEATAAMDNEALNEYSCTLLGCFITNRYSVFFQIGDGAIIRNDEAGFYTYVWWPDNGEYQNTTSFLVDDRSLSNLKVAVIEGKVDEVAIFSDGLQMLALNVENKQVHQPFFTGLYRYLRMADDEGKLGVLNRKLGEYLYSQPINERTDDDKTLFLATRLS